MHFHAKDNLRLPAVPDSILTATAFVEERLEALGCSHKVTAQMSVVIDEILSNIVRHARGAETAELIFAYDSERKVVNLTFLDMGKPYNPLLHEEPDVTLPAEKRAIGGLGIFLVRKLTDGISYEYADGKNILRVQKRL